MTVIKLRMRNIASVVMFVSILLSSCSSKDNIVKVSAVSLDKTQVILVVDEEISLNATITPIQAENKSIRWSSFNEGIAKVNSEGKVIAVGPGSTFINAVTVDGNFKQSCKVIVKPKFIKVTGVSISNQEAEIKVGSKHVLIAEVVPKNATNSKIIWNSSHPNIVFVSNKGVLSALKMGDAVISAKSSDGGFIAYCKVKVIANSVTGITLDETDINLVVGNSGLLVAKIVPENATNKEKIWSSLDPNIASVKDGVVTALKVGETKIYVTSKDGGFKALCNLKVSPVHVESINFPVRNLSVAKNSKISLKLNVIPVNASDKSVVFRSDNSEVVEIIDGQFLLAKKEGEASVTAESVDGGFTDKIIIKVESSFKDGFENMDYSSSVWNFVKEGEARTDNNTGFEILKYDSVNDDINAAHNGLSGLVSHSYVNMHGPVHADNWIISPKLIVSKESSMASFWVKSYDGREFDGYEVYICASNSYNSVADFVKIKNFSIAKDHWEQVFIDLKRYVGRNIYFAIRHKDFDNYMLLLDDFILPPIAN